MIETVKDESIVEVKDEVVNESIVVEIKDEIVIEKSIPKTIK